MFGIWKIELFFLLSITIGIIIVVRAKNLSMKERIIWIFSILIFNIFAILAFFIWKKNKQEV
jgi:hypothetical protein